MRILVTGGAGLIGSRQVCALARGVSTAGASVTMTARRCRGGRARATDPAVRT
ncbi:hypothetical protein GCM10018952_10380 [Streptosporangium vulgare]